MNRTQQVRHLPRRRSQSSSVASDRHIFLARKEEAISSNDPYGDIEYDSEDEQFLQELKAKRTPFQERLSKARRAFSAGVACALILAACLLLMYGLPKLMADKSVDSWGNYQDPRIRTGLGKTINSGWKSPKGKWGGNP